MAKRKVVELESVFMVTVKRDKARSKRFDMREEAIQYAAQQMGLDDVKWVEVEWQSDFVCDGYRTIVSREFTAALKGGAR